VVDRGDLAVFDLTVLIPILNGSRGFNETKAIPVKELGRWGFALNFSGIGKLSEARIDV